MYPTGIIIVKRVCENVQKKLTFGSDDESKRHNENENDADNVQPEPEGHHAHDGKEPGRSVDVLKKIVVSVLNAPH